MSASLVGSQPEPNFSIPLNTSGHGNTLAIGRGISVYWDLQPPNVWPEHRHPTAQIVIALDPVDVQLNWGLPSRAVSESTLIPHVWIVPHDMPHSATWRRGAAMVVFYVDRSYVRDECGCELAEGAVLPLAPLLQQDYLVSRLCKRFHELCHRQRGLSELLVIAGATLLTSLILQAYLGRSKSPVTRGGGLTEKHLELVSAYIEQHLRESLSPALLAQAVHLPISDFSRRFRISTGSAPMRFVWRYRIHRARQLLETGQWKVSAVAAETGFCDQSHLDRRFRREFSCPPGSVIPKKSPQVRL
jgi:AraC family transcriptional regulator